MEYYAHSKNAAGDRQDLGEHLRNVAELAKDFALSLSASDLAYALGLWHDLGKFNPDWQQYLMECEVNPKRRFGKKIDHKAAGAHTAREQKLDRLAMIIQGHHGGLRTPKTMEEWLTETRQDIAVEDVLARAQRTDPEFVEERTLTLPPYITDRRTLEFFLRLLFSTLVDADCLDTEGHTHPEKSAMRGLESDMPKLWARFEEYQRQAPRQGAKDVARIRAEVYAACCDAAAKTPGLFRLTVPTGGGKTRSGMAFALKHAIAHGQQRVIVAVPFITITDQTAKTYRDIFCREGDTSPVVLEDHSAVGGNDDNGDPSPDVVWSQLAAENWDASIVVTTTVQLFESLFANKTSKCRKLHRLANSVIILDEVQALPSQLLEPILDALQELCLHYGTTVVLSTATQPAFETTPLGSRVTAREIVPNPDEHFAALQRVRYDWRIDREMPWSKVAELMRAEHQALAVVNTKADAVALLKALDDPDALHLSTNLCGEHRKQVIETVKQRIKEGKPCRLISTQVIEAGVDLDFPLVLRAFAPLSSIIQAAGRGNREGNLGVRGGRVIIFRGEGDNMPPGTYVTATKLTRTWLAKPNRDPDNLADIADFFRLLFGTLNLDAKQIQKTRTALNYPQVATDFRMIDDETEGVVITRYGDKKEREKVVNMLANLRAGIGNPRKIVRQLQPFTVSVRKRVASAYREQRSGLISEEVVAGISEWCGDYDSTLGITGEGLSPDLLAF